MKGNSRMISRQDAAEMLGTDPQTVTNWINKGALRGKMVGRIQMVDRDTITALFDSLSDLADSKKVIARLQQENYEKVRELTAKRDDYLSDIALVKGLERPSRMRRMIETMIDSVSDEIMSERERSVLKYYLDGSEFEAIGDEFGITRERTRQIIEKAIRKLGSLAPYGDVLADRDRLAAELNVLKESCKRQDAEIADLRKKLNIEEARQAQAAAEGKAYNGLTESERQIIDLLNTNIIDLDVSVRAMNCLRAYGGRWEHGRFITDDEINTVADLVTKNKTDLLKMRNFGKKTLIELDDLLESLSQKYGVKLTFGMDVSPYYERYKQSIIANMDGNGTNETE